MVASGPGVVAPAAEAEFHREIRFAVVMYGGVSLAVYINGVAQELFRLVRATAPTDGDPLLRTFRMAPGELQGTEAVYRELGARLKARFVVDILSGTSAGGINAVYLAKALAENRPLDGLKQLWVTEGDIDTLLNDKGSLEGLPSQLLDDPPQSLLNGQRFYKKLLDALKVMDAAQPLELPGAVTDRPPYVDQLDLFITATDFDGFKRPLPLIESTVDEPQHRMVFHLRYHDPADDGSTYNDFTPKLNPLLAFAARCTASFPVAFVPFRLTDIDAVAGAGTAAEEASWERFFPDYEGRHATRYFVDGGYLDNKPFEAVVAAIGQRRRPLLPVERKLVYIEPDPDEYGPDTERAVPPDAIENVTAVLTLPRVETIRAELEALERRNQVVERACILTNGIEEDMARQPPNRQPRPSTKLWALEDLQDMVEQQGVAYGGYHRLKVSRLTDWLTARAEGQPPSGRRRPSAPAMRRLISHWRDRMYVRHQAVAWRDLRAAYLAAQPNAQQSLLRKQLEAALQDPAPQERLGIPATENRFLLDFDLGYRLRRIELERLRLREALESRERAQRLGAVVQDAALSSAAANADWAAEYPLLLGLQAGLQRVHQQLLELDHQTVKTIGDAGRQKLVALAAQLDQVGESDPLAEQIARDTDLQLRPLREQLVQRFIETGKAHELLLDPALHRQDGPWCALVRAALFHLHKNYSQIDVVRFSVLYTMGSGELEPIEVVRISARDTNLGDGVKKLAGRRVLHFGAFFDAEWRRHDILWGRLDAAERLLTVLLREASTEERDSWLVKAFTAIIHEELAPYTSKPQRVDDLVAQVLQRLDPPPADPAEVRRIASRALEVVQDTEWAKIEESQRKAAPQTKQLIKEYLAARVINAPFGGERAIALLGRTSRVVRELIAGLAERRGQEQNLAVRWVVRVLGVVWGLLELLIPSTIGRILRHVLSLVVLCGVLIVGVGALLGRKEEAWIGAALIMAAATVQLIAAAIRTTREGSGHRYATSVAAGVLLVAAAAFYPLARLASFPAESCSEARSTACQPYRSDMLDLELAREPRRLAGVLAEWRGAKVIDDVTKAVHWDFALIASYALGLASAAALSSMHFRSRRRRKLATVAAGITLAALIAGACDLIENVLLLRMLSGSTCWVTSAAAFGFASLKFGLVFVTLLFLLAALPVHALLGLSALRKAEQPRRTLENTPGGAR
jgi:patatin-related protein